ncbi:hypothetical protein F0L68_24375 [Solihabitans fulvus]|uniref:Excreted virulence factor EspC, type VII ESX diderm n=1 Tax=Solihabitans fulvus TaxID=1892852 RepID=A0A5B2X4M5_9PSEU|nr:type VII secretion target [Solihabitans fulvus]KAA2258115.1 hypothetical protein F0L68_24375 [Solihabitans fulvus]
MVDGQQVDLVALRTHAQHLGGVSDQLTQALAAATQAALPVQAFGPMGASVASMIQPLIQGAQEAFQRGTESLRSSVEGVHATVASYDATESANAAAFNSGSVSA